MTDTRISALPQELYSTAQVRRLDRIAIEEQGIPGSALMERAGACAFRVLRERWPEAQRIVVCCGGGNNGGDGFVVARLAHEAGLEVRVLLLADNRRLQGAALAAWESLQAHAVRIIAAEAPLEDSGLAQAEVIVDALLGTGLEREVGGRFRDVILAINAAPAAVLAVDIPSGLHGDSGGVLGVAVHATVTATFIGVKRGMLTAMGPACCGEIVFDGLAIPPEVYQQLTPAATRISYQALSLPLLPARSRSAHKGDHGHVLVIGGDHGMSGAVRLAAEAAGRVGAGLVSVATRPEHAPLISQACPEVMAHGVATLQDLKPLLARATVVAIGPGLGQQVWAQQLLAAVLECGLPLVVDADALNLLAGEAEARRNWVLTPHPGEAARLLGTRVAAIEQDRFDAVALLQERYGGVAVLKGAGSLVCSAGQIALCSDGNPGMASGGMGDVLTGVIAGLWAQGLSEVDAARLGVCLHAAAADGAALDGERGMQARHVIAELRWLANPAH